MPASNASQTTGESEWYQQFLDEQNTRVNGWGEERRKRLATEQTTAPNVQPLQTVVDKYFHWTSSAEVQGQVDYDADSYSSDSDSTCSEHDTSSVGQDDCSPGDNCLDLRDSDSDELQTIRNFLSNGCGCQFGPKMQHCSSEFSFSDVLESHANCSQLSKKKLDLIVLSHLHCHLHRDEVKGRKQKRTACNFYFMGRQICKKTYLFLHAVGRERYSNLCEHYRAFGLTLRVHGNKGRLPKKTCSFEATKQVSTFISNYAEEHTLVLPGCVPGVLMCDFCLLTCQKLLFGVFIQLQWRHKVKHLLGTQSSWNFGIS